MSGISDLLALPRVGPTTIKQLESLGIKSLRDLFFFLPFRYEDYTKILKINELQAGLAATVKGRVELLNARSAGYGRKGLTEMFLSDETGSVKIVFFNMPFLAKRIRVGMEIIILATPVAGRSGLEFHNPNFFFSGNYRQADSAILPVYHQTAKLSQKQIRSIILSALPKAEEMIDCLPPDILAAYDFPSLTAAIRAVHQPQDQQQLDRAWRRLKFEELFILMLRANRVKTFLTSIRAVPQKIMEQEVKDFVARLSFNLTDDQRIAAWQILKDLAREAPMNRLLEGDVGSGKTVVAAMAMYNTFLNGLQSVMMSPTEILAKQHYATLSKLFVADKELKIALLTGSQSILGQEVIAKAKLQQMIAQGKVEMIVGTHALIAEKVSYHNLGLTVIDEQHRFGVEQRKKLRQRNISKETPHLLSMTATPIPRSLALIIYGDLDLSMLVNMPKDRKPVQTKVIGENGRIQAYKAISEQIGQGRQVFVICPLIDESDTLGVRSVAVEYEKLRKKIFPQYRIAMLHGKLSGKDKTKIMEDFAGHQYDILVSTSVIEVGIDVPNATIMMIEGAERFGLAQLHQFRGRVGRAGHQSYCFVFASDHLEAQEVGRLRQLEKSNNGFVLAEYDLQSRGPGEVYGVRQSGLPELKIASFKDAELISLARQAANEFLEKNKLDNFPLLEGRVYEQELTVHLE